MTKFKIIRQGFSILNDITKSDTVILFRYGYDNTTHNSWNYVECEYADYANIFFWCKGAIDTLKTIGYREILLVEKSVKRVERYVYQNSNGRYKKSVMTDVEFVCKG